MKPQGPPSSVTQTTAAKQCQPIPENNDPDSESLEAESANC